MSPIPVLSPDPAERKPRLLLVMLLLCIACLAISSKNGLINLINYWKLDEYSHAPLILLLSPLLGWHYLTEKKPHPTASWHGVFVLLVSLILLTIARLSSFEALLNYSFLLGLAGLIWAFAGQNVLRALSPAFLYLLFALPLPHILYGNLSLQMQMVSTNIGVAFLNLFNIPVFQDGNIIDLGNMKLQVVEACNGLRYLFPLMSFGFLCALLLKDKMWKRLTLFLSSIPITIGLNALRIAIIGLTVNLWGKNMAEGFLHAFEGYVVFLLCLLVLFAVGSILIRIGTRGHFRFDYLGLPHGPLFQTKPTWAPPSQAAMLICMAFFLLSSTGHIRDSEEIIPPAPHLETFPTSIDDWRGQRDYLSKTIIDILKLSNYWLANYTRPDQQAPVNLYIAYYEKQGIRATIHIPLNCIIGDGWQVQSQNSHDVLLENNIQLPVQRLVVEKNGQKSLVYFWLDERGRLMNSHFLVKVYLVLDGLLMHRSDGALVRLSTSITPTETTEAGDKRLEAFLQSTLPTIRQHIPGKTLTPPEGLSKRRRTVL